MPRGSDVVILILPAVVLLASPLAASGFRAVPGALCLAGLLFLLLRALSRGGALHLPAGSLPLFLLVLFALFQLLPLPPFFLELLAPLTAEWYGSSVWLADPGTAMPLSIRPKSTLIAVFHLLAGGAFYFLTAAILSERERLKTAAYMLCALAVLAAGTALTEIFVPEGEVIRKWFPALIVPSLLPLALGLYLAERPETSFGTRMERLLDFCRRPSAYPHRLAGLAAVFSGGVLIGQSGLPCLAGGVGLSLFALLLFTRSGRRKAAFTALCPALFLLLAATVKIDLTEAMQGIAGMPSFPYLFGAGLGAGDLVPGAEGGWGGAEALAVETGGAGSLLAGLFICAFALGALSAWRQRRRRFPVLLGAAALGSAAVPLVLALTGMPAVDGSGYFLFFLLAGMATAAAHPSPERTQAPQVSRPVLLAASCLIASVFGGYLLFHGGIVVAAKVDPTLPPSSRWEDAARFDPLEDGYRFAQAEVALAEGRGAEALDHFRDAVRLSPLTGEALQGFALARQTLDGKEEVGRLLEASLVLGSGVDDGYRRYTEWLLGAKRLTEAKDLLRRALNRKPAEAPHYLRILLKHGWEPEAIAPVLPRRFGVLTAYGDFLLQQGRVEAATTAYREAVATMSEEAPSPEVVATIATWFARNGYLEDALTAVRVGVLRVPEDPGLRRLAIDLYERAGLSVRADEERMALELLRETGALIFR